MLIRAIEQLSVHILGGTPIVFIQAIVPLTFSFQILVETEHEAIFDARECLT